MLQEALSSSGIEVKDLNVERINFSKGKQALKELKNLAGSILDGKGQPSTDSELLTEDMKQFVNLFVKNKLNNNDKSDSLNGFAYLLNSATNETVNIEPNDIQATDPSQKIIDSIVKRVSQSFSEGKTEIEVKLVPENLGKLTVKIISEEGKLSANIEVKNLEVKQALEAGIVKLRDNLSQNGIHLEQINVSLSDDHYSKSHQEQSFGRKRNGSDNAEIFSSAEMENRESMKTFGYNTLEYIA
jgi:flagellar hook-length control protein FliK